MNTQLLIVGSAKTKELQRRRPRIRISGVWLNDIGFICDSLISAKYQDGHIALKLEGNGIETYNRVVKGLLRNSIGLLQVKREMRNGKEVPHVELKGFWLEEHGFKVGSVILVESGHGEIDIKLLDINTLTNKKASYMYSHENTVSS